MNADQWEEIVEWVEERFPDTQWLPEQVTVYYQDLKDFDVSDVWSGLFTLYDKGRDFAPNGSQLKAAAGDERKASALRDRYDNPALPEPVTEVRKPVGSWLEKWYPDETVSWTEHIRRVHAKGKPCKSRLCDIHNPALANKEETV